MKKLTDFETFAHAYLKHATAEDQKYLLSINGTIITEEITSVDALNEAIEGTLAINPDSEIKVYQITDYDYVGETTDEEEESLVLSDTTEEVGDDVTEEDLSEPVEAPQVEAGEVAQETPKDSPRESKADKKARKLAKKAKKKAAKSVPVTEEIPEAPVEAPKATPVVKKAKPAVKKAPVAKKKSVASTQPVAQLNKDTGAIIKKFDSISHASDDSGVHSTNISKVCRGIRGSAGGFGWKYL